MTTNDRVEPVAPVLAESTAPVVTLGARAPRMTMLRAPALRADDARPMRMTMSRRSPA